MKKTLKISGIVVFALIILFTIIGSFIAIQSRPISGQNTAHISEITRDLLSLKKQVDSNTNQIYKLSKSHDKLQKITWAHGAKVNRVVKAVFETAYGRSSETNKKVQKYTKNPFTNKGLWEQAILLLSKKEAKKALELINLEEKILQNQKKIDRIKPRAFKS